jgi:thioesterase domain-containing protein
VARLADVLRQGGWSQPWRSLIPLHPHGTQPPFFWVLGTKINRALPRYLGAEQPVYGFMHLGADGTRVRYRRVEDIAAHYLAEIRTVQPTGPYYLGGYSFGGLMAFEMAQQLRRQGQGVALLALLDPARPRSALSPLTPTRGFQEELRRHRHSLTSLAPYERPTYFLERVRGRLHAGATMLREQCTRIACEVLLSLRYPLPSSWRDFYTLDLYEQAIHAYHPHSYPGRMVLFLTATTAPKMQATWEPLGTGGVEVHVVPGDHKTILDEPHFAAWATLLREHLRKSQEGVNKIGGHYYSMEGCHMTVFVCTSIPCDGNMPFLITY